ncbi:MAG: ComF family protein [Bacteroidia bacterium]|jgi:ComF family protein
MLKSLLNLFYPKVCCICGQDLSTSEEVFCISCELKLPFTRYWAYHHNPMQKTLKARCNVDLASAMFYFNQGTSIQTLLHELKYRKNKDVGLILGRKLAMLLQMNFKLANVRYIIPVPIHPHKRLLRSYNQSEVIIDGMLEKWPQAALLDCLSRPQKSSSQTKKSRMARWENVKSIFELSLPNPLEGEHVLLVDDVFTTGATIEACVWALRKGNPRQISVATLACAE